MFFWHLWTKYNIDFALCSCGSAVEVDHDQNPIPDEDQVTQHDNNERMLRLVRQHSKRIGAFMWIKPRLESCDQDFEDMIASNRDIIYGIKVHPYHSKWLSIQIKFRNIYALLKNMISR